MFAWNLVHGPGGAGTVDSLCNIVVTDIRDPEGLVLCETQEK